MYEPSSPKKTTNDDSVITITRKGITTTYKGEELLSVNGEIYIDGIKVTESDARIISKEQEKPITLNFGNTTLFNRTPKPKPNSSSTGQVAPDNNNVTSTTNHSKEYRK